jgi:sulfate transport system ATP-binding protein
MSIYVENINKNFGKFAALENINFSIKTGELVALLGPSGSGKTTLLRIIAGLDFADTGQVITYGENVSSKSVRDRSVGFVFQSYALFNHMNVFDNIAFGLKIMHRSRRPDRNFINKKVISLLKLMRLDDFSNRMPLELSGGQRQRVALARALAIDPKILLLDEPFGALDAKVRKELRSWMRRLHNEMNITGIFVTHDQEEALEVADKIVILNHGKIEQIGSPEQVYNQPTNAFVYDFLGDFNVFEGWKDDEGKSHITEYEVATKPGSRIKHQPHWLLRNMLSSDLLKNLLPAKFLPNNIEPTVKYEVKGCPVQIFARPHEMEISKIPGAREYIIATIVHINPAGSTVKLELERKNSSFIYAEISKALYESLALKKGDQLYVRPQETVIFG